MLCKFLNVLVLIATTLFMSGLVIWGDNKKPIVKIIIVLVFLLIIEIVVHLMAMQVEWWFLED